MSHHTTCFFIILEDRNIEETPLYSVIYTTYISYSVSFNMLIIYDNVNVVGW